MCSCLLVNAQTVSLSGTVKKTNGSVGLKDVKISLIKTKDLTTTTDANGAFVLKTPTSILITAADVSTSPRFQFKGNSVVFTSIDQNLRGSIDIFSSDGKRKTSVDLNSRPAGQHSIILPQLFSGINVIRIAINDLVFTRTIICLGNNLFLKNETPANLKPANFSFEKQAATSAVDTLVAEKQGYAVGKIPIESFTKQNIAISLDTAGGTPGKCTRAALQAMIDKYIEAQKAGDPTKMPLAANVKYIQNMKDITADKSICKTALPKIDSQRDIFDVDSCRTFSELVITDKAHPYVIGTRLTLREDKISEINTMVTDKGDWAFNADSVLIKSKNESWDTLPVAQRSDRQTLINACNAYFDKIFDWTKDTIPWHPDCYRIEGSMIAKPCSQGTEGNSVNTTCRTYVCDVEKSVINIYCYFGFGPDSHLFKLLDKKVIYIHTMTACGDTVAAGNDCWGRAAKGKGKPHCDWYSH
jgi:hypothetical protein